MNDSLREELLQALNEQKNVFTIVEGKNDRKALASFGFDNVRTLDKPLYKVVEEIDAEEVLLLTDLDKHGKKLYKYFFTECAKRGIKVNNKIRQLLHESDLRQVEGLANYLERRS